MAKSNRTDAWHDAYTLFLEKFGMFLTLDQVALLAEGVDRNSFLMAFMPCNRVALLAEGVDRNSKG